MKENEYIIKNVCVSTRFEQLAKLFGVIYLNQPQNIEDGYVVSTKI